MLTFDKTRDTNRTISTHLLKWFKQRRTVKMAKGMRGLSNHTETNISETSDHDIDLNFENLGVWN